MSGVHAQLSPSGALRWMACPGSVDLCRDLVDTSGEAAAEGSMLHELSAKFLDDITFDTPDNPLLSLVEQDGYSFQITEERMDAVTEYVNVVQSIFNDTGGTLYVEQRLPIGWLTGEEGAHGTADAVIVSEHELIVIDAKFGRGVEVSAENNMQLAIYALGAMREFEIAFDFDTIKMIIVQPRLNNTTVWTITTDELRLIGADIALAADRTKTSTLLVPTPGGCRWCKAKATCPAIANEILTAFDTVVPEAANDLDLGSIMSRADMIEKWVKEIRAEVERRLLSGAPVTGYKLVRGKRGNRQWIDEVEAEETLKAMRVKHDLMYKYSLVSPTVAEKLAKSGDIGPRQWAKLQESITQAEGKPSVALETDKRPTLTVSVVADACDFNDVTGE